MNLTIDSLRVRECLETTYTHVTYVKSNEENNVQLWYVNDEMVHFIVSIRSGFPYVSYEKLNMDVQAKTGYTKMSDYMMSKNIIKIEKVDDEKMEKLNNGVAVGHGVVNVLSNGVRVLESNIENDFSEAQRILNVNHRTADIDAEYAYNEREYTHYENTYEVKVKRVDDYNRFMDMLQSETCYSKQSDMVRNEWRNDLITRSEMYEKLEVLEDCSCDKCKMINNRQNKPTFEQWQSNLYSYTEWNEYTKSLKTKQIKMAKYLQKIGVSSEVIDFYSTQIKDEKTVYLTVTSAPQFVAGMSYYAKPKSWNGYNGTSCMDTRHGGSYAIRLGGSLADEKLHVAMLHEKLEDLQDMSDKLIARVNMRPIEYKDEILLIPTRYYGNNATLNMLDYALKQLEEVGIMSLEVADVEKYENKAYYTMDIDNTYTMVVEEEVNVDEWIDEEVECTCPMCGGSGEYTVYVGEHDEEREIDCPMCEGTGEYTIRVRENIDVYVNVEVERQLFAYHDNEGNHYSLDEDDSDYTMTLDKTKLEAWYNKYIATNESKEA